MAEGRPGRVSSTLAHPNNQSFNPMTANKTTTSLILTLGLALVASPFALAGHTDQQSHEAMFKTMDTNGDGKISRVEHVAGAKLMFANMDASKDGQVTAAEMTAAHAKMKTDAAAIADASERTGTAATPATADKAAPVSPSAKPAAPVVTAATAATAKAVMTSEEMIKKNDTNKDGQLSAAEHNAAADAMFTKADTNKDDALTIEECVAGGMMKS